MKNLKSIIVMMFALLTFAGCNEILNKGPLDSFTDDNFWSSETNVRTYAFAFYNEFSGYDSDFYFPTLNDNQVASIFNNFTLDVPTTDTNWSGGWATIRRANILLDRIDRVPMSDEAKAHWTAFAKLMRAWSHYKLVRRFGDVPWVGKVVDLNDEGLLYGARENRDLVMDKVLEDLQSIGSLYDNRKNEVNRAVGNAIKSEICLYEGTFRKYRPNPDNVGAEKFLKESKAASQFIMDKSYYVLSNSYRALYNSLDLNGNTEMILYKAYITGIMTHGVIAYSAAATTISYGMSKSAFDAYLFIDGKPKELTAEEKDDAAINVPTPGAPRNQLMNIKHMLDVRDKRLSQTIDELLSYQSQAAPGFTTSTTGYRACKFDNLSLPTTERSGTAANPTDAPLYWLSVIYLNYAEACAELGTITQTDLDNTINKLRVRAGLPKLLVDPGFDDPENNMGVGRLIWEIRRERRCELMMDLNDRYWCLIRWHQLDKLDSTVYPDILKGANVKNDALTTLAKIDNYLDGTRGGNKRIFKEKYYLQPIPSGQTALNPLLGQNPGWEQN